MKIICVGRNYTDHVAELKNEQPEAPVLFMKPDTSLLNKGFPFPIPDFSTEVQYEVEVVIKINKVGKYIESKFAHKYYDQISLGIDFTARDIQNRLKEKGLPWEMAKAFDNSAVVGDFLSKESLKDVQNMSFSLHRNDHIVQKASTSQMLWHIDELIAYASQYFTLKTGDLIFTGTPAGVGNVAPGDILEGFIENQLMFRVNVL